MNGRVILSEAATEPPGAAFRRSHEEKPFPLWLAHMLEYSGDDDPGHEDVWSDVKASIASGALAVDVDGAAFRAVGRCWRQVERAGCHRGLRRRGEERWRHRHRARGQQRRLARVVDVTYRGGIAWQCPLREAIAFARGVAGNRLQVREGAERDAFRKVEAEYGDMAGEMRWDGDTMALTEPDDRMIIMLATPVFRARFASQWAMNSGE